MKLTHDGPAKQEVESTISFTKEDVINALQEFASKRGIQCPPALEYHLLLHEDLQNHLGVPSHNDAGPFISLQTRRDGVTNPIYVSVRAKESGDER